MQSFFPNKIIKVGCLALAAIALGYVVYVGFLLYPLFDDPFDDLAFDQALWHQHQNDMSQDNPRGKMAHDLATLLENERMTRAEVVELLGSSDAHTFGDNLSYELGMWSGFRIDNDTLDVHFDAEDRVVDAVVVQH